MSDDREQKKTMIPSGGTRQPTGAELRAARLKAALKANMAKRKSQAKARMGDTDKKSQGQ
jgi:hypothetical protein